VLFYFHSSLLWSMRRGKIVSSRTVSSRHSCKRHVDLLRYGTYFPNTKSNSDSKLRYDRRSVGQSVLVSSRIWWPRPDLCYCRTVAGLLLWGAHSDGRTGLSFTITTEPRQLSHNVTWMTKALLGKASVNTFKLSTIEAVSQWANVHCSLLGNSQRTNKIAP
jgi:hypothetical protein